MLFSTKYKNIEKTISGTYTVDNEDVVLRCDTSSGPVVINLNTISAQHWNTVYKLYIVDESGNATNNNITINAVTTDAPTQTINNAATQIINISGGSCIVRINSDTKYTGLLNYNPSQNTDTGWLDLQGFSWITTSAAIPQYRVINNQIVFRRNIVIPLADKNGAVVDYAADLTYGTTYVNVTHVAPFTGAGGVTLFAGGCTFNKGVSVFQSASHHPDANYTSGFIIAMKSQINQASRDATTAIYHSPYTLTITSAGLLQVRTLNYYERLVFPNQALGNSLLRQINSKSISASHCQDFNDIVDSTGIARTLNGSLINNYDFSQVKSSTSNHMSSFDPADQTQFGAMTMPLMNFNAYK